MLGVSRKRFRLALLPETAIDLCPDFFRTNVILLDIALPVEIFATGLLPATVASDSLQFETGAMANYSDEDIAGFLRLFLTVVVRQFADGPRSKRSVAHAVTYCVYRAALHQRPAIAKGIIEAAEQNPKAAAMLATFFECAEGQGPAWKESLQGIVEARQLNVIGERLANQVSQANDRAMVEIDGARLTKFVDCVFAGMKEEIFREKDATKSQRYKAYLKYFRSVLTAIGLGAFVRSAMAGNAEAQAATQPASQTTVLFKTLVVAATVSVLGAAIFLVPKVVDQLGRGGHHRSPIVVTAPAGAPSAAVGSSDINNRTNNDGTTGEWFPPECSHLPHGPDRKGCLIMLADASRKNLGRAETLYNLAVREKYDTLGVRSRLIEDGYVNRGWKTTASGKNLLNAQTFQALAGLSSVYALHEKYSDAARTWSRAIEEVIWASNEEGEKTRLGLAPRDENLGVMFAYGPTAIEYHLKWFLYRKAGIQMDEASVGCGYPYGAWGRCRIELGLQELGKRQISEALRDLSGVTNEMEDPVKITMSMKNGEPFEVDDAAHSRYWSGILPKAESLVATARQGMDTALRTLESSRSAIAENGLVLWFGEPDTIYVAVAEYPWRDNCSPATEGGALRSWEVSLSGANIAKSERYFRGLLRVRMPQRDFEERLIARLQLLRSGPGRADCDQSKADVLACRRGSTITFRRNSEHCD